MKVNLWINELGRKVNISGCIMANVSKKRMFWLYYPNLFDLLCLSGLKYWLMIFNGCFSPFLAFDGTIFSLSFLLSFKTLEFCKECFINSLLPLKFKDLSSCTIFFWKLLVVAYREHDFSIRSIIFTEVLIKLIEEFYFEHDVRFYLLPLSFLG